MDKYTHIIQRTISNLRQIAKLTPSQKLSIDHVGGYLQVDTTPIQFITRMYASQDRHSTVTAVDENVTTCMLIIELLAEGHEMYKKVQAAEMHDALIVQVRERVNLHNKLHNALVAAKDGVASLVNTYISDASVSSSFDGILKKIEEFVHTHQIIV